MLASPARWIVIGTVLTAIGLVVSSLAPVVGTAGADRTRTQQTVGGILVVAGWLTLGGSIHVLGRMRER